MNVEMIADYACIVGEGPTWHPMQKRLYWTDIEGGRMFWYEPHTGRHEQCYEGPRVGGMTVQEDGTLLLFRDKGNICVWDEGTIVRDIVKEIPEAARAGARFNDVWPDPRGRVFCGTLGGNAGTLYLLHLDGRLDVVCTGVGCSNGIDFTPDLKRMYFTDSIHRTIDVMDYDIETGKVSNRRNFVTTPEGEGIPDGMTVDRDGRVWSARWEGAGVYCYDPETGEQVRKIELPAKKCSSVLFADDDLTDMYVTTAGGDQKETDGEQAGALFRVRGHGAVGKAAFLSKVVA